MSAGQELRIDRTIDAPVAAVWRAWTEHQAEWFCPPPWRAEIIEQELVAGGVSRIAMHGPDGETMPMEGVILEVVPERRIVSTDALTAAWQPQDPFMVRIDSFEDAGDGRTRYAAIARHWTAEAKAQHEAMGFETGWGIAADQLEAVARRIASA